MSRKKAEHFPKLKRKPWYEELKKPVKNAEYLPQIGDIVKVHLGYEQYWTGTQQVSAGNYILNFGDLKLEKRDLGYETRIVCSEYKTWETPFHYIKGYDYLGKSGITFGRIKGEKIGSNRLISILFGEKNE